MVEIDEKQIFALIQKAKESGSIRIGANETTKAIERGQAKLVVAATDVSPAEIIAHLEPLSKEMNAGFAAVGTRAEIGSAVGIKSTSSIAIVDGGSAKKELDTLVKEMTSEKKEEKKAEAAPEEPVKEEAKEEAPTSEESKEE